MNYSTLILFAAALIGLLITRELKAQSADSLTGPGAPPAAPDPGLGVHGPAPSVQPDGSVLRDEIDEPEDVPTPPIPIPPPEADENSNSHPAFSVNTGGYDLWSDEKINLIAAEYREEFRSFLRELIQYTNELNRVSGSGWNWRINNTLRSGSTYHSTGRAMDLNLYDGPNALRMQDGDANEAHRTSSYQPGGRNWNARMWAPLDVLRALAARYNYRWGGMFFHENGNRHWDPVHVDNGSSGYYGRNWQRDESWWDNHQPAGAYRFELTRRA